MQTVFAIAAGGAVGSVIRHFVNIAAAHLWGTAFPWGTLAVNIAGSFIMGVLIATFAHFWAPPQAVRAFLVTGFLGGLTTFSTFSLDVSVLYERQEYLTTGIYIAASVILSLGAVFCGLFAVRGLVP